MYTYGRNITLTLEKPYPFGSLEAICISWIMWKRCKIEQYYTDIGFIKIWEIDQDGRTPKLEDVKEAYELALQCALILNIEFPTDLQGLYEKALAKPKGRGPRTTIQEEISQARYVSLILSVIKFEKKYKSNEFGLDHRLCDLPYDEYAKTLFYDNVLKKELKTLTDKGEDDPFKVGKKNKKIMQERERIYQMLVYYYENYKNNPDDQQALRLWEYRIKRRIGNILSSDYRQLAKNVYYLVYTKF